jgi:hypothetical protein
VAAHQSQHLIHVTLHHRDLDARQLRPGALFDHLHVLPVRLRLFASWWSATPLLDWHLAPGLDHSGAVVALAVSCHRRWPVGMAAVFELPHEFVGHLLFGFANRASDTQPRVHIQRYAAPEGAALGSFGIAPFSPVLPT